MHTELKDLIKTFENDVKYDLKTYAGKEFDELLGIVLDAYNHYEESERDGVGYLFHIEKDDDIICCLKGGMTPKEMAELYIDYRDKNRTGWFLFGQNYDAPKMIRTYGELVDILVESLHDLVLRVVCYPYANDAYKALYGRYVTDYMVRNGFLE